MQIKHQEFQSADELLDVSADELAEMVKEKRKPGAINLNHSAFNFPRKFWEKILSCKAFEDVGDLERLKLLMMHPGAEQDDYLDTLESDLRVSLP